MNFIDEMLPELLGKKVILYGADSSGLTFLMEAEKAGIKVSYAVDGDVKKQGKKILDKMIYSPYELMRENKEEIKIVICAPTAKNTILSILEGMGFKRDQHISTKYIEKKDTCTHIDMTLGISRGNKNIISVNDSVTSQEKKKVLILGGSTSDPTYNGIHAWSYYLQKELDENQICAQVFNGAVIGYSSSQELLCLIRDGLKISPDIVISYTGYNDYCPAMDLHGGKRFHLVGKNLFDLENKLLEVYKKEKDLPPMYYGEETEDHFRLFLFNLRSMYAICNEFGAKFLGIFQPIMKNQKIEKDSMEEKIQKEDFVEKINARFDIFYERFKDEQSKHPYLYDFTDIFKENSGIFSDICHVNEKGNRLIADHVKKLLLHEGYL